MANARTSGRATSRSGIALSIRSPYSRGENSETPETSGMVSSRSAIHSWHGRALGFLVVADDGPPSPTMHAHGSIPRAWTPSFSALVYTIPQPQRRGGHEQSNLVVRSTVPPCISHWQPGWRWPSFDRLAEEGYSDNRLQVVSCILPRGCLQGLRWPDHLRASQT